MPEPERPSLTLPEELTRRAEALVAADGGWQPPQARDAATVMLIRDSPHGIEVLLQRRPTSMKFAPGMYVFPGGRVEDADAGPDLPWDGPAGFEPFALRVAAPATARFAATSVAAARETWEEAGVLLADQPSTYPQRDVDLLAWLVAAGRRIDGHHMYPWVHWITPEVEERRFDTRFLVVRMPDDAVAQDFGVETDRTVWMTGGRALDGVRVGEMVMLPPTVDACAQLAEFDSVDAALADASQRRPRPYLPRPLRAAKGSLDWQLVDGYTGEPFTS